jgi:hypothetical protein
MAAGISEPRIPCLSHRKPAWVSLSEGEVLHNHIISLVQRFLRPRRFRMEGRPLPFSRPARCAFRAICGVLPRRSSATRLYRPKPHSIIRYSFGQLARRTRAEKKRGPQKDPAGSFFSLLKVKGGLRPQGRKHYYFSSRLVKNPGNPHQASGHGQREEWLLA